jgi:hypothetical protein
MGKSEISGLLLISPVLKNRALGDRAFSKLTFMSGEFKSFSPEIEGFYYPMP